MASARRVHAVFAVDFGMQYTKVAVWFPSSQPDNPVFEMMEWTGERLPEQALRTAVAYRNNTVVAIGTAALELHQSNQATAYQCFKLGLLQGSHTSIEPLTLEREAPRLSADRLGGDFLAALGLKLEDEYRSKQTMHRLPDWKLADIDILMSIPSIGGIEAGRNLVNLARRAGLQSLDGRHLVHDITLTEPEAATIHVLSLMTPEIKTGSTILVLDVGGGTSDLCMTAVTDKETGLLNMDFMKPVSSRKLGGSYMDKEFLRILTPFLERACVDNQEPGTAALAAHTVLMSPGYFAAKSKFQCRQQNATWIKESVQAAGLISTPLYKGMTLDRGVLKVESQLVASLFDGQIFGKGPVNAQHHADPVNRGGIMGQLITMRDDLVVSSPSRSRKDRKGRQAAFTLEPANLDRVDTLDFVVFSGGLCGSRYLRNTIEDKLRSEEPSIMRGLGFDKCCEKTRFLVADEPQMSVALGLIKSHMRQMMDDPSTGTTSAGTATSRQIPWKIETTVLANNNL